MEIRGMFVRARRPFSPAFALPFSIFLLFPFYLHRQDLIPLLFFALLLLLTLSTLYGDHAPSHSLEAIKNTLFGILYISFCLGHMILIRALDNSGLFVFFILATTWCGDTFAYYIGTLAGRRPLAPIISPNKTVEGALGGLAGSLVAGLLMRQFLISSLTIFDCVTASLVCGVFGQLGDLAESMIKRGLGAKNSGIVIPGHGGLLDRIDGVLFSGPAFYFYHKMVLS